MQSSKVLCRVRPPGKQGDPYIQLAFPACRDQWQDWQALDGMVHCLKHYKDKTMLQLFDPPYNKLSLKDPHYSDNTYATYIKVHQVGLTLS